MLVPLLLKTLPKIAGPFNEVIFTKDGDLAVTSAASTVLVTMKEKLYEGEHALSLPALAINSAFSGRDKASISYAEGVFTVAESGYKVTLHPTIVASFVPPETIEADPTVFPEDMWSLLSELIPRLGIEKLHSSQPDPLLTFVADTKSVFLGVQDKFQFVFAWIKSPSPEFESSFQIPHVAAVGMFKNVVDSKAKFRIGECSLNTRLKIAGLNAEAITRWPEDENSNSAEDVLAKAREFKTFSGSEASLSKADLTSFLSNSKSISVDDTRITLKFSGPTLLISAKSSSGTIKQKIPLSSPANEDFEFSIELRFLNNFVKKLGDSFRLSYKDGVLVVKSGNLYVVACTSV